MPLEDPHSIDMELATESGAPVLVITDAGVTVERAARLSAFRRKLDAYAAHIVGREFAERHPGVDCRKASILLISQTPATSEMMEIEQVHHKSNPDISIAVNFHVHESRRGSRG